MDKKTILLTTIVCGGTVITSFGNGFRLPNQDPEGIARGNAFTATADNPSAIYYNPAGITQLEGQHIRAGLYLISTGVEFTSALDGKKYRPDSSFQPVPQLYYVNSPKDSPLSFGLGIYTPYGLSIDWGRNTPFATRAEEGSLIYLTANPVIAWQICPTLSFAIGPQISYSEAEFKQSIGFFPGGDRFEFKGDDIGYSFNAGLRWQPHEQWAFGVNYRYLTTMGYDGDAHTSPSAAPPPIAPFYFPSTAASASIRFPQSVAVGVSYRPTENWNLEVNADWTDWDNLNTIAFQGLPYPPITLNYKSSWMYNFGVTRQLPDHYFISAGYIFSENSSPDAGFHPLIPDSDLHLMSVGGGRRGERWDWAISYTAAYNPGRTVSGSAFAPSALSPIGFAPVADGEYEILNHAINIAATFKF
jgi:long-chain fatty acid transport protein